MYKPVLKIAFMLAFSLLCSTAQAITLDWDTSTWAAGPTGSPVLTRSYDLDGSIAGDDVTVTISGDTAQLRQEILSPFPQTPTTTTNFQGGLPTQENTLSIALDLTNQSQAVTVTVDFSSLYTLGVENVSFTIFDVDFANSGSSQYQDQLRSITALSIDGVTQIAPTITTSANNVLSGSGLSQVVDGTASTVDIGPGSGNGNVTINFGTNAIQSFSFVYGSGSGTVADPTYQHIGLHDITFTPVPEINPAWSAVVSCLAAACLIFHHGARFRK